MSSSSIDLASIIDATQSLSSEVDLDELLAKLVGIVTKISGAEHSILLTSESGSSYHISAMRTGSGEQSRLHGEIPWQGSGIVPETAIRYVLRTAKPLVLADATRDTRFSTDPYIKDKSVRSLLCVPIGRNEELIGVIYLENNAASDVFNTKKLDLIKVMTAQAAISIENANLYQNLERQVEERTKELQRKSHQMRAMLDNLEQGIFTILEDNDIDVEYSSHLEHVFEKKDVAGSNAVEFLFDGAELSKDEIDQTRASIESLVGGDEISFVVNEHLFVREYTKTFKGGRTKLLSLDWTPIVDDHGKIEKTLVAVKDITKIRELELGAQEKSRELQILVELIDSRRSDPKEDFDRWKDILSGQNELLDRGDLEVIQDELQGLFRDIHNTKGVTRSMGFKLISESCHTLEEKYDSMRKGGVSSKLVEEARTEIVNMKDVIDEYAKVFEDKIASMAASEPPGALSDLIQRCRALLDEPGESLDAHAEDIGRQFVESVRAMDSFSLTDILPLVEKNAKDSAKALGKEEPRIDIREQGLRLTGRAKNDLIEIMTHSISNCMDHGIESDAERLSKGKPKHGTITVELSLHGNELILEIGDDGRGLNLAAIEEKARKNGLLESTNPSDEEIALTLFSSGISTAESVSMISGRGVGTDSVRAIVEGHDGSVRVKFTEPRDGDYRPFNMVLILDGVLVVSGVSRSRRQGRDELPLRWLRRSFYAVSAI